jgi:hypothetical protein
MKKVLKAALLQLCLFFTACGLPDDGGGVGQLRVSFEGRDLPQLRSRESLPDTSDFLLNIKDASGRVVYDGSFGACPEKLDVAAGSYTIKAVSSEFVKPAFSSPQYGGEVCVIVPSGGSADVKLSCYQLNSGVILDVDENFLSGCPDGTLFLSSDQGKLLYSYSEDRIAYFQPGKVSLILSQGGKDEVLLTRQLQAREVLVLGVSVAQSASPSDFQGLGGIFVGVDTSKVWLEDNYVIGGAPAKGASSEDAMTVAAAIANGPVDDVWVSGYIVGGDLTSAAASFKGPFKSRTNLLLGPRSSTADRSACISVFLPSGKIRDALNLVDNPDVLGQKVCLKGNLVESYYGLVGLKPVDEFVKVSKFLSSDGASVF